MCSHNLFFVSKKRVMLFCTGRRTSAKLSRSINPADMTEPRKGKQSDQRAMGDRTQIGAPRSEGMRSSQNEPNLIIGIDVWDPAARRSIDETRGSNLGVRIESGTESGKTSNNAQTVGDRDRKGRLPSSSSQSDPPPLVISPGAT
jgi:hypothetical protein